MVLIVHTNYFVHRHCQEYQNDNQQAKIMLHMHYVLNDLAQLADLFLLNELHLKKNKLIVLFCN